MEVRLRPRVLELAIPEPEIQPFLEELVASGRPTLIEWAKGIAQQNGIMLKLPAEDTQK